SGGVEAKRNTRLLNRTSLESVTDDSLFGFGGRRIPVYGQHGISCRGWRAAIEMDNLVEHLIAIELSDHGEDDVGRTVVAPVVRDDVFSRERPQSGRCAYSPPAHSMLLERRLIQFFRCDGAGIIQLAIVFLKHHLDFPLQLVRIERRMQ